MSEEVKNCPFCGSSAVQVEQPLSHRFNVYCNQAEGGCGAEGALRSTREAAIAAWSKRADRDGDRSAELTTAWMAGAESVRDQAERDAEDAARYRWLRDEAEWWLISTPDGAKVSAMLPRASLEAAIGTESCDLDDAIDAARAGERG